MNYLDLLKNASMKHQSIVCMGLDPVIEDIPIQGSMYERIFHFYENILNAIIRKGIFPASVKPNYAFYAQYGFDGLHALQDIITLYQKNDILVILDYKRGDIGKTAMAYAREAFIFFHADAVTLSPFLGYDSIKPYVDNFPEKGFYILNKTSNKSSVEMQDIVVNNEPYYKYISNKIIEWHSEGIGAVVGATFIEQLMSITSLYIESGKEVPLLIPGIGSQGGDLKSVVSVLNNYQDVRIHRINSSGEINYAYRKNPHLSPEDASVKALDRLNCEIYSLFDRKPW